MNYEDEARDLVKTLGLHGDLAEKAAEMIRISLERAYFKGGAKGFRRASEIMAGNVHL